jgi:succinate dehydrogenase / fumarate reductase flavoprotein subunit
VQFHPTGMVWPPSVRGTLITEGVRGEGGVLKNSEGRRFMFEYIPEMYQGEFADTEKEANEWVAAVVANRIPKARRPPELLTRDVVARAIRREVLEGRGAPHGGVYLDIASRRPPAEIKKKLPSMYHQFKELADVDITQAPMEVGPTCHYMMGGIRVDPETQESTLHGLFAAGEVAAGLHGANRLGGNSLSDLLVFGKRAGEYAAAHAANLAKHHAIDQDQVERTVKESLRPFERANGENPYSIAEDLQKMMQKNVGIVRTESDLLEALEALKYLRQRAEAVKVGGNIQYNPGWHLALDLKNMLDISEAVTKAALTRAESRGAHTREDFPESDSEWGKFNIAIRARADSMEVEKIALPEIPPDLRELLKD